MNHQPLSDRPPACEATTRDRDDQRLAAWLHAVADDDRPSLPTASQLLWRHEALARLAAADRQVRRAARPVWVAVAIGGLLALAVAMLLVVTTHHGIADVGLRGWSLTLGLAALVATALPVLTLTGHGRRDGGLSSG